MKRGRNILIALAAVGLSASACLAQAGRRDAKPAQPPQVTRAQQLLVKRALEKQMSGTLLAELTHSKQVWKTLTPKQMNELRERYYAFLRQSPDKQAALLEAEKQLRNLSPEQRETYRRDQEWLTKVVDSLTPAERAQLKELPPQERARRLLELKALLEREAEPAAPSAPSSAPASRPAK